MYNNQQPGTALMDTPPKMEDITKSYMRIAEQHAEIKQLVADLGIRLSGSNPLPPEDVNKTVVSDGFLPYVFAETTRMSNNNYAILEGLRTLHSRL